MILICQLLEFSWSYSAMAASAAGGSFSSVYPFKNRNGSPRWVKVAASFSVIEGMTFPQRFGP
jgi:hypothetical protein